MRNRIVELANLVPKNSVVADIGCDHAYLLIELFRQNKISFAYAIDNKDGPIKNARLNVNKNNLSNKIKIIKTDGLDFDFDENINLLVFAGLGGMNVINIINKDLNKLKKVKYIITDIHRNNDKVISFIQNLGFSIENSIRIIDNKKEYFLIRYKNENI